MALTRTMLVLAALLPALPAQARRGLSPRGQALVRQLQEKTGYLLHDRGTRPNAADRQGWTDGEVRRMAKVLKALPPQLRFLGRPTDSRPLGGPQSESTTIVRDAMSQQEQSLYRQAEQSLRQQLQQPSGFRKRLGLRARLALVRGVQRLNMGTVFGNAYRDRREIRLYNELFRGSRIPGLGKMLAFTTVHEIGHRQLYQDTELRRAWTAHFEAAGRAEYAPWCGYAAGSVDEGYGVGIGTFAVAPKLLKDKAPRTYKFFADHFGEQAFRKLRGGPTARWAIQATYGLGDMLQQAAGPRQQ